MPVKQLWTPAQDVVWANGLVVVNAAASAARIVLHYELNGQLWEATADVPELLHGDTAEVIRLAPGAKIRNMRVAG
jgi:hypothetical protein